jgi:MFS transporter, YNFM family, putative membrane transport protein
MPEGWAGELSVTWRISSSAYHRISAAMFLAGFATFSLIYCVQPLLPAFARDFHIGPAESSLALSATTGALAAALLCAAPGSEVLGRRGLMFGSMCAAAILNVTDAFAPTWHALLIARALEGIALGGVPAVAMAYLAEEIHPQGLGLSMGLYVGGTAFGGMIGRVGIGALTEFISWHLALGILGAIDLLAAIGFFILLPDSRYFKQQPSLDPSYHLSAWLRHLRHPGLPFLFLIGCLTVGAFVTIYNYASFRLAAPPYQLSPTQVSLIFVVYLFGMVASPLAGALADRVGRGPLLITSITIQAIGVGFTLLQDLGAIIVGIVIMTIGFFIAHSIASGWVGSMAGRAKGHAASLYLLAYYLGSSVMGSIGGWFWASGGWSSVAGFTATLLAVAWAAARWVHCATRCSGDQADRRASL